MLMRRNDPAYILSLLAFDNEQGHRHFGYLPNPRQACAYELDCAGKVYVVVIGSGQYRDQYVLTIAQIGTVHI